MYSCMESQKNVGEKPFLGSGNQRLFRSKFITLKTFFTFTIKSEYARPSPTR